MGQKIRPDSLRLGIIKPWVSRWFFKGRYKEILEQDEVIRKTIKKRIASGGVVAVNIERTSGECRVNVKAARPGLIIGRGGEGVNNLKKAIEKTLRKINPKAVYEVPININIEELKRSEVAAALTAQQIAWDLEKRFKYRRTIKKQLDLVMQNREVKGVKIKVSGRLDGAEIARSEWLVKGKVPLTTLRADIDYGEATAFTTYGTIGIKVWIYKGEIFEDKSHNDKSKG